VRHAGLQQIGGQVKLEQTEPLVRESRQQFDNKKRGMELRVRLVEE